MVRCVPPGVLWFSFVVLCVWDCMYVCTVCMPPGTPPTFCIEEWKGRERVKRVVLCWRCVVVSFVVLCVCDSACTCR